MSKLLKDMPEHMERIENNQFLKNDIIYILNSYDCDLDAASPCADEILENVAGFVNQNYTFGGDLAKEYERGFEDGQEEYEEESQSVNEEKLCTEYVVEKFGDCKTLEEFIEVYNELRNISYTYMS